MEPTAGRPGTPWTGCLKLAAALAFCTALAAGLFVLSGWLILRKASFMGGGLDGLDRKLEVVGMVLLPTPLLVFPVGALMVRGLVHREITRRRQLVVLWGFALFPLLAAPVVYASSKVYERVRHWVTAQLQLQEEKQRLQADLVAAFRAAPIEAEVLQARLLEEHDTPEYGGGTLELTIRVQNVPPFLPDYHLTFVDLAQRVVSGRARSRLRVEPPYRIAWERRGASGRVTVRNERGRWSYVEDGTSQVLDSGPDTFTTRIRYAKRVPGLDPPRGVILYLFFAEDRRGVGSESGHLYLAVPFPPFS